jgi:hypothetical protein
MLYQIIVDVPRVRQIHRSKNFFPPFLSDEDSRIADASPSDQGKMNGCYLVLFCMPPAILVQTYPFTTYRFHHRFEMTFLFLQGNKDVFDQILNIGARLSLLAPRPSSREFVACCD